MIEMSLGMLLLLLILALLLGLLGFSLLAAYIIKARYG
jgi:hypothetical protein